MHKGILSVPNTEAFNLYNSRKKSLKPLNFGTSGLRDIDEKLTDMQVFIATKGFLRFLFSLPIDKGGIKVGSKVSLAGDFRPSTPKISIAIAAAIVDSGCEVDYCGKIPTPVISLWGFHNKTASIMVTGSHNPYGQNGVKFNKSNSEVMKSDEKFILEQIEDAREEEFLKSHEDSLFDENGNFKKYEEMNALMRYFYLNVRVSVSDSYVNESPKKYYIDRYKNAFGKILSNEKVVFYQQTAVGREIIPEVLEELGAEVIRDEKIDEKKEFVPVDTEDMKPAILDKMANLAHKHNCFITITVDGDSDRPAVLFVRKDKEGKHHFKDGKLNHHYIKGDKLNILVSILLRPDFVAVPVSVNHKAIEFLRKIGIEIKLTKVGSPHVIKAMHKRIEHEKEKHLLNNRFLADDEILEKLGLYAFEVNGGGLRGSSKPLPEELFEGAGDNSLLGKLGTLPTRDAAFPIICALILAKKMGVSLEQLMKEIFSGEHESYSHAGLIENLPGVGVTEGLERYTPEIGKEIINFLSPQLKDITLVNYRGSIVECKDDESNILSISYDLSEKLFLNREILSKYIKDIVLYDDVEINKINYLDGIRIYLSNGEIIHFRPSGNSAQFRIYVEADNEERAIELVNRSTKHKDGILVKMINDFIERKMQVIRKRNVSL